MTDFLMQPKTILDWAAVFALAASLVVMWLSTRFPTKAEFDKLQATMNGVKASFDEKAELVESRVAALEAQARHLPTREDFLNLQLALERQSSDRREQFAAMGEKLNGTQAGLRRIEELLLQEGASLKATAIEARPSRRRTGA